MSGIGACFAFFTGELLPPDKDKEALRTTEKWRIIYAYIPIGI